MLALTRAVFKRGEEESDGNLGLLLTLLGQENCLDVGEDTTLSDGDSREKLVQLLVVPDGELKMTGDDTRLLVVTSSVSCQLENLSGEVFHDSSQVDGSTSTDTLGVVSLAEEPMDTADRELKPSTVGSRLALSLDLTTLATSRHDEFFVKRNELSTK